MWQRVLGKKYLAGSENVLKDFDFPFLPAVRWNDSLASFLLHLVCQLLAVNEVLHVLEGGEGDVVGGLLCEESLM